MKIKFLIMFLITLIAIPSVFATINSVTLSFPSANQYRSTELNVNLKAEVVWNSPDNITNVTFWFKLGTNYTDYTNSSINATIGSNNITAGKASANVTFGGNWTYNISANMLAEGSYTVLAEARNHSTKTECNSCAKNSSSRTFTIDRSYPSISLIDPNNGRTVSLKGGGDITFRYTPIDTNMGNSTLYIDGNPTKSSLSSTTTPNISSGSTTDFTYAFDGNNASVNWIIELTDLAGLKTNSSQWSFVVFTEGSTPKEKIVVPRGQSLPSQPVTSKGTLAVGEGVTGFISNYWWAVIIVIAISGFIIYKEYKNKKK